MTLRLKESFFNPTEAKMQRGPGSAAEIEDSWI